MGTTSVLLKKKLGGAGAVSVVAFCVSEPTGKGEAMLLNLICFMLGGLFGVTMMCLMFSASEADGKNGTLYEE